MAEPQTTYLPDRKSAPERLGCVLVLGLGRSGKACVDYLRPLVGGRVEALAIAAGEPTPEARRWAAAQEGAGTDIRFDHEAIEGSYDLCIASPGISELSAFYRSAAAHSAEVISEVEFAWRESAADAVWVAVTGTNGKTTTTALAAHLLEEAGFAASAVGNIGDACIEAVAAGQTRCYVAEVSSYQLASCARFAPNAAVMLNITPDHLSWHGSHEAYVAAKAKLLDNLATVPGAVAVLDAVNDTVRAMVRKLKAVPEEERGFAYVPVGAAGGLGCDMRTVCGAANAAFLDGDMPDGMLHVALGGRDLPLVRADELQAKGLHNVGNALAAATAALAVGAEPEAVRRGLRSFGALEHRIEPAGTVGGVECFNDSKATNVDAVLVALRAFEPRKPIVLLGGRDKGTDLSPLVEACAQSAQAVVLYGESLPRFSEAFRSVPPCACGASLRSEVRRVVSSDEERGLPVLEAPDMEHALDAALDIAAPGDVVLLSPACASFDEFSSFEERGDRFKQLVADRARKRG